MGSLTFALMVVFLSSWGCIKTSKSSSLKLVQLSVEISSLPFLTELLGRENSRIDHIDTHTMAIKPKVEELLKQNNVQYKTINHEHEGDGGADEDGEKDIVEQLIAKMFKTKKRRKRHAIPERETEKDIKKFCEEYISTNKTLESEDHKDEEMVYNTTYGFLNIMKWLKTMEANHSDVVKIRKYGDTFLGKCLVKAEINKKEGQKVVVVDSGIHAREWGSVSSTLIFMHKLVHEIERGNSSFSNYTFIIIPVYNPDGYVYSRAKTDLDHRLWRKNRVNTSDSNCTGVDLNRNFCVVWDACTTNVNASAQPFETTNSTEPSVTTNETPTTTAPKNDCEETTSQPKIDEEDEDEEEEIDENSPCYEAYKGEACNDQDETKAFIKLMESMNGTIEAYFNVHTAWNAWFYPYFYNSTDDPPNAVKERAVANTTVQKIEKEHGVKMQVGRPYGILWYYTCGSVVDWVTSQYNVPYAYALELTPYIFDINYVFRINNTDLRLYGEVLTTGVKSVIEESNKDYGSDD